MASKILILESAIIKQNKLYLDRITLILIEKLIIFIVFT